MNDMIQIGYGIFIRPYNVAKILCFFVAPWFVPNVRFDSNEQWNPAQLEYLEKWEVVNTEDPCDGFEKLIETEGTNNALVLHQKNIEAIEMTDRVDKKVVQPVRTMPRLMITLPSTREIGIRVLNTLVIDLPWYTIKSMVAAPMPTLLALFAILPPSIWKILAPQIFKYLIA
jgi:hypothetical protein